MLSGPVCIKSRDLSCCVPISTVTCLNVLWLSVISSTLKVFDVRLNGHVVVKDLDIFDRVGHSTAHDEIIPMSIKKGKLSVQGEVSTFTGKLHIEFVKVNKLFRAEPWSCAGGGEVLVGGETIPCLRALTAAFAFSRATMTIQKSVPYTSCKEQWKVSTVSEPEGSSLLESSLLLLRLWDHSSCWTTSAKIVSLSLSSHRVQLQSEVGVYCPHSPLSCKACVILEWEKSICFGISCVWGRGEENMSGQSQHIATVKYPLALDVSSNPADK